MRSTTMAKMAKGATGRWAAGGLPVARARRRWRDASVGRARRALSAGTRASGSSEAGPLRSGVHQPGDIVNDRYEVRGVLGMGGSGGDCFVAERRSDGSKVAMKVLSFRDMRNWKQLELFEREAKTLQNLSHPGIPRYVDYFEVDTQDDKRFYLIQEIAPGVTLTRRVEEEGWRPNEGEVKEIALRLLDILDYLGSLRPPVVHRDLKPDNIVVDAAGGEAGGAVDRGLPRRLWRGAGRRGDHQQQHHRGHLWLHGPGAVQRCGGEEYRPVRPGCDDAVPAERRDPPKPVPAEQVEDRL